MNKLPVLATLAESARLIYQRRNDLLRVGLVFMIGFFGLGVVMINYLAPLLFATMQAVSDKGGELTGGQRYAYAVMFLYGVVEFLLIAVFAVGWHRLMLLGPARAGPGLGIAFGARELRYFGKMWLAFLALVGIAFAIAVAELLIAGLLKADPYSFLLAASIGYLLLAAYVLSRIAPAFAAFSIDLPYGFARAWQATAGSGLQLLAVYLAIVVGWLVAEQIVGRLADALGLGIAAPYALLFIGAVMTCCQMAMLVSANALAFRRLSGWTGPA
jgi:hypothetical protein